jgi:adenylate cyclase
MQEIAMTRRLAAGLGAAAAGVLLALVALTAEPGRLVEAQTFDWRVSPRATPARDDISIVDINESTVRALAPVIGRWPWPRTIHAGVIAFLARSRARAIVYDVQFTEPDAQGQYRIGDRTVTGAESDAELVAAVRRAGNVVLLADAMFLGLQIEGDHPSLNCAAPVLPGTTYAPGSGLASRPSVCLPFPALRDAAAAVGHNLLQRDPGGVSRAMFPFVDSRGVAVPSLGMATVLLTRRVKPPDVRLAESGRVLRVGAVSIPLREDGQLVLNLHGPYLGASGEPTFQVHSFFDVLLSEERARAGESPAIPLSAFEGKIVFVGTSASGLADVPATAFGGSTPGMYLQATFADNVLSGNFMRRSSRSADFALIVIVALGAAVAVMTLPVWWALAALAAGATMGWIAAARLASAGLWVPVVAPAAALTATFVAGLAWQYFVEGREKRAVKRLFGRYVSPAIFHQLMTNPGVARIGGERRFMSVLFSDIRGFTSASEAGAPEAVVAQLNEYLGEMVEVLFRHQGTLDKFVGDQVMGLFGAPVGDAQHADHAVAAAIDMSATLDRLNARWAAAGKPAFEIGIGVHSGPMIAGNVGSEAIMSYTVIGDAVNLGSRIESLNKEFGTRILISDATKQALTTEVDTRRVGEAAVKGRREPVIVHEVLRTRT